MKYVITVIATLVVLAALALLFPYTGLFNVAASSGHTGLARWYLETTAEHSISARASGIDVPADLADSARIARAVSHFTTMCVVCHGAPGVERGEIGKGLTPQPPRLSEEAEHLEPQEIYWVLEHGIKMSGMPAYGETHSDEELWDLVAFVERLPEMTPEQYQTITASSSGHHGMASDSTGASTHDHADGQTHGH